MTTLLFNSVNEAIVDRLRECRSEGERYAPRGKPVVEIRGTAVAFDMRRPVCTIYERRLGYRFMAAEAAWILSGDNRLETIKRYSPFIWEFSDDGFFYSGAYGPRIIDQLTYVCDMLADDADTRQAVIDVWRPNPRAGRDIPCTLSFQFMIRGGALHCTQSMRSSDIWLGYPYDAFNASMLSGYIMLLLRDREKRGRRGLTLGTHTMLVGSQHVYDKDAAGVDAVLAAPDLHTFVQPDFEPYEFTEPQALIDHLWALAAKDGTRTRGSYLIKELIPDATPKADVYRHQDCVFNYCPTPGLCRTDKAGCVNRSP
jgi:thymidylate synthase